MIPYYRAYYLLFISGILLFFIALGLEGYYLNSKIDIQRFKSILQEKEALATKTFPYFYTTDSIGEFIEKKKEEVDKDDIIYLVYEDKELDFWSNNLVDVPEVYEKSFYDKALIKLNNGYYAVKKHRYRNLKIIALIPIYYEYEIPNSYLKNEFHPDLKLLYKTKLSLVADEGHFISNSEGQYLFSLIQSNKLNPDKLICIIISILYFLGLMLAMSSLIVRIKTLSAPQQALGIITIASVLIGLRSLMLLYEIPHSLYSLSLFNPILHASSYIFRSLGDYWINALVILLSTYWAGTFNYNQTPYAEDRKKSYIILILLMAFTILLGIYSFNQIKSLVLNSSFSLQVHTGSGIEFYTIWAYAGAAIFLSTILIMIRSIVHHFQYIFSLYKFYQIWLILIGIASIIALFINKFLLLHLLFIAMLGIIQGAIRYRINRNFNYTLQIIVLLLAAFYLTSLIGIYTTEKEQQIRSAKAESIVDSNAPITKAMLETMSSEWNRDKSLLNLFQDPIENETQIKEHLHTRYFTNYWSNYDIQILICTEKDQIESVGSNNIKTYKNCFITFNELLQSALRIGNSPFYELTFYKGLIPYVGMLSFITEKYGEVRLFIRIELNPYGDELGYPELLMGKQGEVGFYGRYSYAKYINQRLRYATGSFDYYGSFRIFDKDSKQDKRLNYFTKIDGYSHYIYNVTDSYKIIVSEEELSLYKKYIAFPYIFFLLFFIFLSIWALEAYPWFLLQLHSFRHQIKIVLILMISIVFIVVGGASLYYSFSSNQNRYKNEHKSKIKMLRRELFSNIESAKELDILFNPQIEKQLKNYARVLGADINLYDIYGVLLATSQPDIFSKGLLSNRMNYKALAKLNTQTTTEVTAQERIGNLEYTSIYVTLWNNKNEPVAYLNVPYFMKYKEFKAEMQDVIIGVFNINLLFIILALLVAFAISQRITSPLVMLREKFSQIRIGQKNEKINYTRDDEIKVLVNSYNNMVDKLEESTKKLTQSERESAWREMARQVAHEIKNPLTPMKLNIQFLQRSLEKNAENWEEQFSNSSKMLLKQIDDLSSIASAFSDFAKMPKIQKEKFNIIELLQDLVMLYDKGDISIRLISNLEEVYVMADHNRLRRAFINLITNAMQSIKTPKEGYIKIVLQQKQVQFVEIAVIDNGRGIPEGVRSKIFNPNFTTKNSGMGLGLAMTKDIINQSDGIISFETELNKGSIFRVTLPTTGYHS